MVVLDLDGHVVEGEYKPSSDTYSHLYIYRNRPDVNGVVHTHSRYATAFAAVGRPIPVYLTAQADEFGGEIPCAGFSLIGDDSIGRLVVEGIGSSPAILLKNHGVFTVGPVGEVGGQGRRDDRGRRRDRVHGPPAGHARRDPARCRGEPPRPVHERLRAVTPPVTPTRGVTTCST